MKCPQAILQFLAGLLDEPPTAHSLAGFIAAHNIFEIFNRIDGPLTRQIALAGLQNRASLNIGGFRVSFYARRRSSGYLMRSMMAPDGHLIG